MQRIKNKIWMLGLIIFFGIFAANRVGDLGFFADDFDFAVRAQTHRYSLSTIFARNSDGTTSGGSWRPLTVLSYWLSMGETQNAYTQHSISIVLYCMCALILFFIAELVFEAREEFHFLIPIIFLVLPIHAEPLVWIAARGDLLAAVGALAALYFWIRGQRCAALIMYLISILSKEVWILLPGAFLYFEYEQHRISLSKFIKWALLFGLCIIIWFFIRYQITSYGFGGYSSPQIFAHHTVATVLKSVASYGAGVFTYGEFQARLVRFCVYWYKPVSLLVITFFYFLWHRMQQGKKFLWLAHILVLVPILFLEVPFRTIDASVGEQRYWFAPSTLLILCATSVLATIKIKKRVVLCVLSISVIFFTHGLFQTTALFVDAARYRDTLLAAWQVSDRVAALPDSLHGVHLFASLFFEDALLFHKKSLPKEVISLYQFCANACEEHPLAISTSSSSIALYIHLPRLLQIGTHGLHGYRTIAMPASSTLSVWDGEKFVSIKSGGVENK